MGMGLFISENDIVDFDFFRPDNTPILLCKEHVKYELEQIGYENLIFLRSGKPFYSVGKDNRPIKGD